MQVQDQKPKSTGGGDAVFMDNHRVLNTVLSNTIPGAFLAGNVVTLPAGTYYVAATAPVYTTATQYSRLKIAQADDTFLLFGSTSGDNTATAYVDVVSGQIILGVATGIKLMQFCNAAIGSGLGTYTSDPEIATFADLRIWQIKEGV